ncbi:isocitrate/isopropylmalate dehydrogenase family protein [Salinisphaera sp. USBA-960]|uniref:isocitrate/isopropylmalate dehydrogenase family protein n=1 Tax=Salinisphaera orenii TaxID=856731 RepID=UPI000DBE3488|nr:isocitrate/isopropylmalate dehydrogenase family protein [Salifodinibacter halophilus]NNC26194.1 isocitrate/isopropylmalate dehydrogenase family protein [Salifodinibacter halophilus]
MTTDRNWRIAVCPGDGIGPEVVAEAERVLGALTHSDKRLSIETTQFEWPSHTWLAANGGMAPDDYLSQLAEFDAVLLGALGDPGPTSDPDRRVLSDAESLAPLLGIRKYFDLWCCQRPCRPLTGTQLPLADARASETDFIVLRENSEGEYVNQGGRLAPGSARETATQLAVFSRQATDRLIRAGFERARQRAADRRDGAGPRAFGEDNRHAEVCLITKRNAQRYWGDLYTERFNAIADEYPDVATRHELVDAAAMKFVQAPWQFDVVVASNLHGDILTDLAAAISGGLGVSPSANINPDDRSVPSMFEPTHGSAPDIAGRNQADPTAMLRTTAMMLDWMGEVDSASREAARRLDSAVAHVVAMGGTGAQGAPRATDDIGTAVVEALG